jgi:hypothetical protein
MSGFVSFKEGFFEAFRGFAKAFSISEVFSPPRAVGLLFFTALHLPGTVSASEAGANFRWLILDARVPKKRKVAPASEAETVPGRGLILDAVHFKDS